LQQQNGEIWGRPARGSSLASVKAYRDALPAAQNGIEFVTTVAPTPGSGTPFEARWYEGTPGVTKNAQGYAVIPATVTRKVP
jgi:hypothetical protein